MTSMGTGREIVRALEGLREGTLRILLRQPSWNRAESEVHQKLAASGTSSSHKQVYETV